MLYAVGPRPDGRANFRTALRMLAHNVGTACAEYNQLSLPRPPKLEVVRISLVSRGHSAGGVQELDMATAVLQGLAGSHVEGASPEWQFTRDSHVFRDAWTGLIRTQLQ